MKKIYIVILFVALIFTACAKNNKECVISGKIDKGNYENVKVILAELGENDNKVNVPVEIKEDGSFHIVLNIEKPIFTYFYLSIGEGKECWQVRYILYNKPGENYFWNVKVVDRKIKVETKNKDCNNKVLISFKEVIDNKNREIWDNAPGPDKAKETALSFFNVAENCINDNKELSSEVKEYIKIWGYNEYLSRIYQLPSFYRKLKKKSFLTPKEYYNLEFKPYEYLDNETALLFRKTISNIAKYIKRRSVGLVRNGDVTDVVKKRIELLKSEFKNTKIVDNVVGSFISTYKYSYRATDDFDRDLEKFTELAQNISNENKRNKLVNDFAVLKNSIKGSKAPNVIFKDRKGKDVRISDFKGNVVYIDLWASWCGPCCKEVPYLQKLEKEYEGKDIVFLSISLDSKKESWIKKMDQLKMHGHQLHIADSDFNKMLNVSGIPHFIIYDAEGLLYMHRAPRPSSSQIRGLLNKLLK